MKSPYRGGPGPLPLTIGGRIGMVPMVIHTAVAYTGVHLRMAQCITKGLDTLLTKNQDRGVEQVAMRMRVLHQEAGIVLHQEGLTEDMVEEVTSAGRVADTANQ